MRAIHVWRVRLDIFDADPEAAWHILSDVERSRAGRFKVPTPRRNFVAGRAALRRLLGGYLGVDPGSLALTTDPGGKVRLAAPAGPQFNLSHSGDLGLIAFAATRALGVDVEEVRAMQDMYGIARSHFAPEENAKLLRLPEPEHGVAFFETWTRKEAFMKAIGVGLGYSLSKVAVSLRPETPSILRLDGPEGPASEWQLHALHPAVNYVGAVAYKLSKLELSQFDFAL